MMTSSLKATENRPTLETPTTTPRKDAPAGRDSVKSCAEEPSSTKRRGSTSRMGHSTSRGVVRFWAAAAWDAARTSFMSVSARAAEATPHTYTTMSESTSDQSDQWWPMCESEVKKDGAASSSMPDVLPGSTAEGSDNTSPASPSWSARATKPVLTLPGVGLVRSRE